MARSYFASKELFNQNLSATPTPYIVEVETMDTFGYTFKWSGGVALAGTFNVEVSFDNVEWFTLEIGAITLTGASGQHDVIISNRYKYARPNFVISAGSADFVAWYSGKAKGA